MRIKRKKLTFVQTVTDLAWWRSWFEIVLGCTILGAGFVYFINPYNLVPGGVYGASIVVHNLFPSLMVGTIGYFFDIPLMILSMVLLGAKLGSRTIVAALITPMIMNIITNFSYPTPEAIETLDPALLLGGKLDLSDHLLVAVFMGSVMSGVGCAFIARNQATSGGTDIVAMIMQKYMGINFSKAILIADGMVVLFGLIVIGFGVGSKLPTDGNKVYLSLYSLICILINSRALAYVLHGNKDDKLMFIITAKPISELREYIIEELDRTATSIKSSGLYSEEEKQMLFLVVSNKECEEAKRRIKEYDPQSFVVITDVYNIYGDGWKPLPNKDDIEAV